MVNSIQSQGRFLLCSDKYFITLPKSKTGRKKKDEGDKKKPQLLPFLLPSGWKVKGLHCVLKQLTSMKMSSPSCFSLLVYHHRVKNHPSIERLDAYLRVFKRSYEAFCACWIFSQSQVDKVKSGLMKRDASLIAAISGTEVDVASI